MIRPLALLLALLAVPAPAHSAAGLRSPVNRWAGHIAEASRRFGIPQVWIRRVMHAESGGRTELEGRPIISRAGAMGLMQVMPATWAEMRRRHGLGPDPHAPGDNILAGTAYLRAMYDRFGYPGLFAAYNAGPARYADHLRTGRRLPSETRTYIMTVAGQGRAFAAAPAHLSPPVLSASEPAAAARPADPARSPLFVPLTGTSAAR